MAPTRAVTVLCVLALASSAWARQLSSAAAPSLTCFSLAPGPNGNPRPGAIAPVTTRAGSAVCVRYQYKCTKADAGFCSPADIKAGAFKWVYTAMQGGPSGNSPVSCAQIKAAMAANPQARDVTCCTSNKCNAPDARDKVTKVVSGK